MDIRIDTIRAANAHDADTIMALVNQAYRPAAATAGWTHESRLIEGDRVTTQQLSNLLGDPGSVVLLGFCRTQLAACVLLETRQRSTKLGMFAVRPEWQNWGLGKYMLQAAEDYARRHFNAAQFTIHVISARAELVDFYLRRGYGHTGEMLAYPATAGVGRPKQEGLQMMLLSKQVT